MGEYIEREDVLRQLMNSKADNPTMSAIWRTASDCAISIVQEATAADVVEVKRGRWIESERENIWGDTVKVFECTNCKKFSVKSKGITVKSDFCPKCGADMRERRVRDAAPYEKNGGDGDDDNQN